MDVTERVRRARMAYSTCQWSVARAELRRARDQEALDPDTLSLLAMCEWWLGEVPSAVTLAEEAFRAQLTAGRVEAAARGALDLALISYTAGEAGLGSAWFARARRALAGRERSVAGGYLVYAETVSRLETDGELTADGGGAEEAAQAAAQLTTLAETFDDPALRAFAGVLAGLSAVLHGHVQEGFDLLDEAMLTAVGGRLPAMWAGDVYCSVLHLCEALGDLNRMRRWTDAMESWASPLSRRFTYYGVSRVHRLQLSSAEGDWDRVVAELDDRSRSLAPAHGWVAGEGFRELGDVRRLRGDVAGAKSAYAAARDLGIDPQPGPALLTAAAGDGFGALAQLHASLATRRRFEGGRLLLAGVHVAVLVGALPDARSFAERLAAIAQWYDSPGLRARSAHAHAALALAAGQPEQALTRLGEALEVYRQQRYRYGVGSVHELLARAHLARGERGPARAEHATALAVYRSLGAQPDVDRLTGRGRTPGGLTGRELEVLAAISAGATNKQVASELVISEKTVGRHLANIYRKLEVSSRTAAAAWARRHGIGS